MSYILDALRRADAERERERGGVPGLHTQALSAPGPQADASRALPGWVWGAIGLGIGLLVALVWWLGSRNPPAAALPAAAPASAAPAASVAPSVPAAIVAPVAAPTVTAPRAEPVETRSRPQPPVAAPAPKPESRAASANALPVLPYERLPDDVRRQLPRLAVDGSVYSEQPAQRILIIGGQLFHEGDSVAPGVVLEHIEPKSAVFRWHDWRYAVAY